MALGGVGPTTQVGITVTVNVQRAIAGFQALQNSVNTIGTRFQNLGLHVRSVDRILGYMAVGSLVAASSGFIKMAGEMERLQVRMGIFEKTTAQAEERLDQIIKLAQNSPFRLSALTESFVKLKSAGIEPIIDAEGNGPLKNLVDALAAFGGNEELLKRATIAIQQMAGKGVISMEELRQQLGEAVPTALRLMAEGMGISVSKLITEVSRGNVAFEEGILPFFDKLAEKYGGAGELLANTFLGSINIMITEINKLAVTFNRSGGLDIFTAGVRLLTEKLRELNDWMAGNLPAAIEGFFRLFDTYAPQIAAAANAFQSFIGTVGAMGEAIVSLLSLLPPESLTYGLIGYMIAGKRGAALGAILGPAHDIIEGIFVSMSSLVQGLIGIFNGLGVDMSDVLFAGVVGWFFFGRRGGVIGTLVIAADKLGQEIGNVFARRIGELVAFWANVKSQLLAGPIEGLFNTEEVVKNGEEAGKQAYEAFMKWWNPDESALDVVGDWLRSISGESETTADDIRNIGTTIQSTIDKIRAARQQYEGAFGSPDNMVGLSPSQQQAIERFGTMMSGLDARLASARANGNEAIQYVTSQLGKLGEVESVLGELNQQMNQFLAEGNIKAANELKVEIDGLSSSINLFRSGLGELMSIENAKVFDQIADSISKVNASLLDYSTQGLGPIAEASSGVNKQFEPLIRQIGEAREKLAALTSGSEAYAIALALVEDAETRVIQVREQALARAVLLANRQLEDARITRENAINAIQNIVVYEEISQSFDRTAEALDRIRTKYDSFYQQLDTLALDYRRQVEDGILPEEEYNKILSQLEALRARLQTTQGTALQLALYETTAVGQLWQSVGETIEESLGQALENLITRTGSVKDVLISMYNDITRAAINYLLTAAKVELFGSNSSTGFNLFQTIGSGIASYFGGGAAVPSSPPRFAKGGVLSGPVAIAGEVPGEQEGIFPLARGSDGKLGVRAIGAGGGSNWNITIHAVDAQSVRELFMKEGSTLINAIEGRRKLNRGMR